MMHPLGFILMRPSLHLFDAQQTRVLDLCNQGTDSRYMLAYKLAPQTNGLAGSPDTTTPVFTSSEFQFDAVFSPVANLTQQKVNVKAAVQGDIAVMLAYKKCNWNFDIGYDFWARSHEQIRLSGCCPAAQMLDGKTWALKGDAQVYGFNGTTGVALAGTESSATIYNGTNIFGPTSSDLVPPNSIAITNPNVDNNQFAYQGTTPLVSVPSGATSTQTNTSIQPVALSLSDLNLKGTKGLSNKIFVHLNYTGEQHQRWQLFFGLGGSAEFGNNPCGPNLDRTAPTFNPPCGQGNECSTNCFRDCAITQWGAWIKTGVSFE